ncbi:MAG: zinc transport system ATP-binding protein [Archaeoglobi archaeon]|nr:zinc transport system ATP-binding protein [Archaeoglobi archaeon]
MNAVEVRNVSYRRNGKEILKEINLTVKEKDFLSIIGPNGAGKTTLLRIIAGILEDYEGEVRIFGEPPEKARKFIGYVPQETNFDLSFPMTVFRAVILARYPGIFRAFRREDFEKALRTLEMLGIENLKDRKINELSGGELQRVLLARALVRDPKILLLDEPTSHIDFEAEKSFYDLLAELNREITIILVTHDINVVSRYTKSVACLNKKLFFHGDKDGCFDVLEELYQTPVDIVTHGIPHRILRRHEDD